MIKGNRFFEAFMGKQNRPSYYRHGFVRQDRGRVSYTAVDAGR